MKPGKTTMDTLKTRESLEVLQGWCKEQQINATNMFNDACKVCPSGDMPQPVVLAASLWTAFYRDGYTEEVAMQCVKAFVWGMCIQDLISKEAIRRRGVV